MRIRSIPGVLLAAARRVFRNRAAHLDDRPLKSLIQSRAQAANSDRDALAAERSRKKHGHASAAKLGQVGDIAIFLLGDFLDLLEKARDRNATARLTLGRIDMPAKLLDAGWRHATEENPSE